MTPSKICLWKQAIHSYEVISVCWLSSYSPNLLLDESWPKRLLRAESPSKGSACFCFSFPALNPVQYLVHSSHSINAGWTDWNFILAIPLVLRGPCRSHGSTVVHFLRTYGGVWVKEVGRNLPKSWQSISQHICNVPFLPWGHPLIPVTPFLSLAELAMFSWTESRPRIQTEDLSCPATREMVPKRSFLWMSPPAGKFLVGQAQKPDLWLGTWISRYTKSAKDIRWCYCPCYCFCPLG